MCVPHISFFVFFGGGGGGGDGVLVMKVIIYGGPPHVGLRIYGLFWLAETEVPKNLGVPFRVFQGAYIADPCIMETTQGGAPL